MTASSMNERLLPLNYLWQSYGASTGTSTQPKPAERIAHRAEQSSNGRAPHRHPGGGRPSHTPPHRHPGESRGPGRAVLATDDGPRATLCPAFPPPILGPGFRRDDDRGKRRAGPATGGAPLHFVTRRRPAVAHTATPYRGRESRLDSAPPPSEPDRRISRIRLSSWRFTSERTDRPSHGLRQMRRAPGWQRKRWASVGGRDHVPVLGRHVVCVRCYVAACVSSRRAVQRSWDGCA
jgi:hypothetical protein